MYPIKPFEDCLEKVTYTTKIQRKDFLKSGDFPVVSQEVWDINGYWHNKSDVFTVNKPVILFGDHTKIIKYIDFDFVLGADGVKILQPKAFLDSRYFYYFLQSIELKSLWYARHYRLLRELNISLPPLSVQLDIVAQLDSAMAEIERLRSETEMALASTREVWESTLESVFAGGGEGWGEKRLGDIINFLNGFAFKSTDVVESSNTQLIRMWNLYWNQLDLDRRAVFYPDNFAEKYSRYLLEADDLIISLTWTTGKEDYWYTVRIPETTYNLLLNQRIAKIIIVDEAKTLKNYLLYFLLSRTFLDKLYETANWTRQANLSTDTMRELTFFFPKSLPEQSSIVTHLDAVRAETERLESLYTEKLASLDELRRSVLQEAFS